MSRFPAFFFARRRLLFTGAGLLVLVLICLGILVFRDRPFSPELSTPIFALNALSSKSLYFNGPARPWLLAHRPELLAPEEKDDSSERSRSLAQAVQSPPLFRQLDRRYRFDTLFLVGDPSQSRPLLEHLMETRDWTLTYLDHTSLVFKRGAVPPWDAGSLKTLQAKFHGSKREEATFLAQAAIKMLAVRLLPAA
ncbi:MAG: hypothetical protein V4710_19520, partial [Verrucomicrobiota bacterium]